ncbi:sarcosine oxidase subunit gamma family protein [Aromatoleum sp.]|uniref:sarcosine oxidase subunit gamma family protein n=1 Tax=Aromatoleum sp. TaxID=2307007 RepID=UPI002FCB8D1D
MDLNPRGGAVKSESPLAMSRVNVVLAASARDAGVVVREKPFLGHLVLRGNAQDEGFRSGVERVLGLALPLALGLVPRDESRGVSIQWMSPDEWLILVPAGLEFEAEAALRRELSGHYAAEYGSTGKRSPTAPFSFGDFVSCPFNGSGAGARRAPLRACGTRERSGDRREEVSPPNSQRSSRDCSHLSQPGKSRSERCFILN